MAENITIGMASYRNQRDLQRAVSQVLGSTSGEYKFHIIHNPSEGYEDGLAREYLSGFNNHPTVTVTYMPQNVGYVGAVNHLFDTAETEFIAYVDNDAFIDTPEWDKQLLIPLEQNHQVAMSFPNGGAYPIPRGSYTEVLWGVGFCWIAKRSIANQIRETNGDWFDTSLGHQEEVDFQMRLRLAGYKIASVPEVKVTHNATSSNDPAAQERISKGVINFVNKWNKYHHGPGVNYFSNNVTRFEDWNSLYIEEWMASNGYNATEINANAETTTIGGKEYDLIKVPRWPNLYRGRTI